MTDSKEPSARIARLLEIEDYRQRVEQHRKNQRLGVAGIWNPPLTMDEICSLSQMEPKLIADREELLENFKCNPLTADELNWFEKFGRSAAVVTATVPESAPPSSESDAEKKGAAPRERDSLRAELDRERQRSATLEAEVERLRGELQEARKAEAGPQIRGATYSKLIDVLAGFQAAYPDQNRAKLDADIRPWIQKTTGCSEREKHVFGTILAEHFGLKD